MEKESVIQERQKHEKNALIEALKEMPIVQIACKKAGVGRATYYRWLQEDQEFKQQTRHAMDCGVEVINDMSESQIIILIKEKKFSAINFWLKHHHKQYGAKDVDPPLVGPVKSDDVAKEKSHWKNPYLDDETDQLVRNMRRKAKEKYESHIKAEHLRQSRVQKGDEKDKYTEEYNDEVLRIRKFCAIKMMEGIMK